MSREKTYTIETERENDGRWIAEVVELPGVLAYGESAAAAQAKVEALALRVLAEEIEESEAPEILAMSSISFART